MSLVRFILDESFRDGLFEVALFDQDREVDVDGYKRVAVPRWTFTDRQAEFTVLLGGYAAPFTYDRYVLFAGGTRVDEFREETLVSLPTGWSWDWTYRFVVGSVA